MDNKALIVMGAFLVILAGGLVELGAHLFLTLTLFIMGVFLFVLGAISVFSDNAVAQLFRRNK